MSDDLSERFSQIRIVDGIGAAKLDCAMSIDGTLVKGLVHYEIIHEKNSMKRLKMEMIVYDVEIERVKE